jgi:thiol-disulfide isomerase/thioredoxin
MISKNKVSNSHKRFWNRQRLLLTAVVFSLVTVGGISSCTSSDEKSTPVASQPGTNSKAGAPPATAPAKPAIMALGSLPSSIREAKLKSVNGSTITLADYSGKVLLVNVWATWCGPCRIETPELVKIHKEFQSRGLELVGLTNDADPRETPESVSNFVRDFQVDYHIGWAPAEVLSALYQIEPQRDAIPQSVIISRDGHILQKFVGFSPVATPPQIRQAIESALKG